MSEERTAYKHDASDRKLDQSAEAANESGQGHDTQHSSGKSHDTQHASGPGHDPAEIAKHDDAGKDRLFEGRQQHDEAEKNSEKTRLARDNAKHDHDVGDVGTDASA